MYEGKSGGNSSSKITKIFTFQKFILELSGNFFHFSERKLSLSGLRFPKCYEILKFTSLGKRTASVGICEI